MILYSSTGRFTKLGMSLTDNERLKPYEWALLMSDNEPSQALLMPISTCVAYIITHGNHQQKCPEMKKKYFALCLIVRDSL